MPRHRNDRVDDGRAREDDRHHNGRGPPGSEREQNAKGSHGSRNSRDQRPGRAFHGEAPTSPIHPEDNDRRQYGSQKVGDSNEQERLIAAVDRVAHPYLPGVEKQTVEPPSSNGHECVDEPCHTGLIHLFPP